MIPRTSTADIEAATAVAIDGLSDHDRDEMAIPSYLHANPLIKWLMWRRYETIAALITPGGARSVLEFGCGIGLFLPYLCQQFGTVYAMDLFPQFAQSLARTHGIEPTFVERFDQVDDAGLDAIVAADVLEHLDDLQDYLRLFRAKLKPGGELLVSGPTESLFYRLGRVVAGFADKGDYHHTNIDALIDEITAAGFVTTNTVRLPFSWLPCLFKICRFERRT